MEQITWKALNILDDKSLEELYSYYQNQEVFTLAFLVELSSKSLIKEITSTQMLTARHTEYMVACDELKEIVSTRLKAARIITQRKQKLLLNMAYGKAGYNGKETR